MKKIMIIVSLLAAMILAAGCGPRLAGSIARAAFFSAAVVGTAAIIAEHDAHYHHYNCGCPRHYHDGHWVYQYEDGWEYYDNRAGVWYRY